jgi:predicted RNase H-like HicB family nuclease
MQIRVIIEYDTETKSYSAVCPELPGCTSCGDTEQEAVENIQEAIRLYLEPDDRTISSDAKVYEVVV